MHNGYTTVNAQLLGDTSSTLSTTDLYRWFIDDTELHSRREAPIPDAYIVGGVLVRSDQQDAIERDFEEARSKHLPGRAPVKWNVRDLKKDYERADQRHVYDHLLDNAGEIRWDLITSTLQYDFQVVLSVVQARGLSRQSIKPNMRDLAAAAFSNGLMRVGKWAISQSDVKVEVFSDWPAGNDPNPMNREYASAYNNGKSYSRQNYHSGALRSAGFADSIRWVTSVNSTMLQFTDLIVGAFREFVIFSAGLREDPEALGIKVMQAIEQKVRGYPLVMQKGIICSPKRCELATQLRRGWVDTIGSFSGI